MKKDFTQITIPKYPLESERAELIYKNIGDRNISLTFLPPYEKKYEKAPVFLMIPGGGWAESVRQAMIDILYTGHEKMRKAGFAVVSIDYRVTAEENIYIRDVVTDCFDAVRYLAHFAKELEIDPESFYVTGHSAGGHLALMLAYAPEEMFREEDSFTDSFCIKATAPLSPPVNLYPKPDSLPGDFVHLISDRFHPDTEEERKLVSPDHYVTANTPPTILCAGTSDWLVFSASSEQLYELLQKNHVPSELVLSIGGGHLFEQIHKSCRPSLTMDDVLERVTDFCLRIAEW